jgi:hypothetical protein
MRSAFSLPGLLLVVALLGGPGCKSSTSNLPKTYAVKGKVVYPDGQPYSGGLITFKSQGQDFNAVSAIGKDGSFTLETLTPEGKKLKGAVEGNAQVSIMPDMSEDQTKTHTSMMPIVLPELYMIKPDDSNDFTIKVERKK